MKRRRVVQVTGLALLSPTAGCIHRESERILLENSTGTALEVLATVRSGSTVPLDESYEIAAGEAVTEDVEFPESGRYSVVIEAGFRETGAMHVGAGYGTLWVGIFEDHVEFEQVRK